VAFFIVLYLLACRFPDFSIVEVEVIYSDIM